MSVPTRSGVAGAIWPPVVTGEAAILAALLAELETSQWLSADEIAARQFEQLEAVVAHHACHSPHFRDRLAAAGMTVEEASSPAGFARLPLLTRRNIQTATGFFSETLPPLHGPVTPVDTSGSTGEPLHVRRTALGRLDWLAMTMRDHRWHDRDLAGRFCAIRAHIDKTWVIDDWGPPASLLHHTGRSMGIPMTVPIAEQVKLIAEFRPTSLLVYPSNLTGILDQIAGDGTTLDGISDIRTIGEILTDETRDRVRDVLGAGIADNYSSQEVGYVALQCPVSGLYHVMAETMIVEVLDGAGRPCNPGEIGRVVLTDLRNFASPLIRYEIADHAEAAAPCPCGRGLPTIARIRGRSRNLMVKPNGDRSWPQVGRNRFRALAGVIQYQFVQHTPQRIEVKLLLEAPIDAALEDELRRHVQKALGFPFDIDFTYLRERIETGPTGKFEEFVSRVPM